MNMITPERPPEGRIFVFLLASARLNGNTERLTRVAAAALTVKDEQRWIHLSETPLAPFRDIRHDAPNYPAPEGHERTLAEATLMATDLVVAAPLYWYSLPASAKLYLDYWSAWMRVPGLEFKPRMKGKRMWGITVISDDDDATAEPLIETLRLSANYLQMDWRGVLMGHGNRPGDVEQDTNAVAAAATFFNLTSKV
jgi:multimeric flavodoxin WrbA